VDPSLSNLPMPLRPEKENKKRRCAVREKKGQEKETTR
jgi:hypothetical protein